MMKGIELAKERGFKIGVVTNSYWATCVENAELWLKAISELLISDFSISDDEFHFENGKENLSKYAKKAAIRLNIPINTIKIEKSEIPNTGDDYRKSEPVIGDEIMFRGRAADLLIKNVSKIEWYNLRECPYENLDGLGRIYVDCFGNAQICQGLSIGNIWRTPLSELIRNYNPNNHPICGPLLKDGSARLIEIYNLKHEVAYIDEFHLCYSARKSLLDRFPEYLGPKQVYGLDQ